MSAKTQEKERCKNDSPRVQNGIPSLERTQQPDLHHGVEGQGKDRLTCHTIRENIASTADRERKFGPLPRQRARIQARRGWRTSSCCEPNLSRAKFPEGTPSMNRGITARFEGWKLEGPSERESPCAGQVAVARCKSGQTRPRGKFLQRKPRAIFSTYIFFSCDTKLITILENSDHPGVCV